MHSIYEVMVITKSDVASIFNGFISFGELPFFGRVGSLGTILTCEIYSSLLLEIHGGVVCCLIS